MWNPADLPSRTSSMEDLAGLVRQSETARSSSKRLFKLLRRTVLALSIPAALFAASVVPTAQPVAVETAAVTASVDVAASSASGSLTLGTPRTLDLGVGTVTASVLNVRSGPSTGYSVLTTVWYGSQVTILGKSGYWYNVRTSRGTVGWMYAAYVRVGSSVASAPTSSVVSIARQYVGRPYVYGAAGPYAFDCSGFTQYVFGRAGISISRTAASQYYTPGTRIRSYSALLPGDLIFFANTCMPGISHVGIYVGNGQMIHAGSSRTGVAYANIYASYYTSRFAGGVRPYR